MFSKREYSPVSRFNTFYDYVITAVVTSAIIVGIPGGILFTIATVMK